MRQILRPARPSPLSIETTRLKKPSGCLIVVLRGLQNQDYIGIDLKGLMFSDLIWREDGQN
jgi:hypothetical protein